MSQRIDVKVTSLNNHFIGLIQGLIFKKRISMTYSADIEKSNEEIYMETQTIVKEILNKIFGDCNNKNISLALRQTIVNRVEDSDIDLSNLCYLIFEKGSMPT